MGSGRVSVIQRVAVGRRQVTRHLPNKPFKTWRLDKAIWGMCRRAGGEGMQGTPPSVFPRRGGSREEQRPVCRTMRQSGAAEPRGAAFSERRAGACQVAASHWWRLIIVPRQYQRRGSERWSCQSKNTKLTCCDHSHYLEHMRVTPPPRKVPPLLPPPPIPCLALCVADGGAWQECLAEHPRRAR